MNSYTDTLGRQYGGERYRATDHLRTVLREQGRKRSWLARQAGISPTLLHYLMSGERTAAAAVAERISLALGVPLFLLFERTGMSERLLAGEAPGRRSG